MTEEPGWESPGRAPGEQPEPPRPPVSSDWAAQQPAPYGSPTGYGQQPGQPPPPPPGQQPPGWASQPGWGQQSAWLPPKPGVIPLRPLGVGEILDGAISTIRAKPRLMIGLSAVVAVLTQLVTVPVSWVLLHDTGDQAFSFSQTNSDNGEGDLAYTASSLTATATQALVTLVATLLLTGMLTVVLSRAVLGQDIDARQAWEQARPRMLPLIGVTILVFLVEVGVAGVLLGPGVALAIAGAPDGAVVLAFLVGVPLLVVALPYLYVLFALAPAAVVLEKQSVFAALTRSRRLVKGAWWRTFGILLLINIIAGIVGGIFGGIFTVAAAVTAGLMSGFDSINPYELVPLIITGIGSIVGSAITWPFTAVASALIYVDRRIRREGLDLELARAAGFTPPGQSTTPGTPLEGDTYGGSPSPAAPPPPPYDG